MPSQGVPWAWGLALLSLLSVGSASAADSSRNSLVDRVRAANDRFKDVKVAVAEGYAPIPCASGIDGGAMATALDRSTNYTCGPGRRTHAVRSRT